MPESRPSSEIKDLVDFFGQWPSLRTAAISLQQDPKLDAEQALMLDWMIRVIDRVGPADLDVQRGPMQ